MYPVSQEYLQQIIQSTMQTYWYGSIRTPIGTTYSFDPETIVEGSGKITREICPQSDIVIGTTCSAELDISLIIPNVDRYELYNGVVKLYFQLKVGSTWETVPVGEFIISEPPERSQNVITLHAYDNMMKFNKDFGLTLIGTPYYLLNYACNACGMELGTSQDDIANYVNGTVETYTYQELEIYTYRDLIGYVASYLCCYAYIGVDGKLYLEPYSMTAIRDIDEDWRYEYKPKDYEAYYTALEAYFAVAEETELITLSDGGLTYDFGTNPLTQFNADNVRQAVLLNIITRLAEVRYTPFTATVPCDPSLMVGDVLNFTGNHAVDGKLSAITKQVININGGMELSCAGTDPNLNVLTAKEKQIQNVTKNNSKDGMYYYDYANAGDITIGDGETARIILFEYVTTKETHVDFHAEAKCEVDTTETVDEETGTYTENDGVIHVKYMLGGAEVTEYYPVNTFFDGTHLLTLLYTWWASANIISAFEVYVKCEGCSITIPMGAARAYIAGVGLVGDGEWDGSVHIYEEVEPVDFSIIRKEFESEVDSDFQTPYAPTASDNLVRRNFGATILKGFMAALGESLLHRFSVLYTRNEMEYNNVVVSGSVWVLENTSTIGTITTPDCSVSQIVKVNSNHSGDDVTYIVSFDGGSTWWTYANGWVAPDYSQEQYGMVEGTMKSITSAQWAEKLNGTIKVRAILSGNASLNDIQIFTEVYQ